MAGTGTADSVVPIKPWSISDAKTLASGGLARAMQEPSQQR
jgi:hypothetical protein